MFSIIPLNILGDKKKANYLTTGLWSEFAFKEAEEECEPIEVFSGSEGKYQRVPSAEEMTIDPEGAYFHFCMNETVHGVMTNDFPYEKIPAGMPVVCDMSSCICSEPVDWSKFDLVYAGAHKNMGPSGVTVVIFRDSLFGKAKAGINKTLNLETVWNAPQTYYNTPCTWGIYMAGLNYKYMKNQGMDEVVRRNEKKAALLFSTIDNSDGYYNSPVEVKYRSKMNIPFFVGNSEELATKFASEANSQGLKYLKGHQVVGGIRASIYNAMPLEGVQVLVDFMHKFRQDNQL